MSGGRGVVLHSRIVVPGSVSGVVPRVVLVLVALWAFVLMPVPYAAIAVALAVVGAFAPGSLGSWGCALVIGLAELAQQQDASNWHPYATLAVVHLLHVLGALAVVVPWRARMEVRVLRLPLLRFVMIQVPAQAVLAVVLLAAGSLRGVRLFDAPIAASFAFVAAVFIAMIALVLALVSPRNPDEPRRSVYRRPGGRVDARSVQRRSR